MKFGMIHNPIPCEIIKCALSFLFYLIFFAMKSGSRDNKRRAQQIKLFKLGLYYIILYYRKSYLTMLLGRAIVSSVIQKKRSEAHLSAPDRLRSSYIWISPIHPTIWPYKLHPNTSKSTLVGSVMISHLEPSAHTNGPSPYIQTTISGRRRQTPYRMRPWPARLWRALIVGWPLGA